jgi:anthraniloyl-CoA monooxygenase
LAAVRQVWPAERPLSVRISASDWAEGGLDESDLIGFVTALRDAGVDLIDVSTGQCRSGRSRSTDGCGRRPSPISWRSVTGLRVIAVGNIHEAEQGVDAIVAALVAPTCVPMRPSASRRCGVDAARRGRTALCRANRWPPQYLSGRAQFERNLERAAQPAGPA